MILSQGAQSIQLEDISETLPISIVLTRMKSTKLDDCPICLEPMHHDNNLCITRCKHKFHTSCLLQIQTKNGCPLCRKDLIEKKPKKNNHRNRQSRRWRAIENSRNREIEIERIRTSDALLFMRQERQEAMRGNNNPARTCLHGFCFNPAGCCYCNDRRPYVQQYQYVDGRSRVPIARNAHYCRDCQRVLIPDEDLLEMNITNN